MPLEIKTTRVTDGTWVAWVANRPAQSVRGATQSEAVGRLILARGRLVDEYVKVKRELENKRSK